MGRRATIVTLASIYSMVWAVTWAIGDRNTVIEPGGPLHYPGVFVGGLPPVPDVGSPELTVVLVGAVVVLLIVGVTGFVPGDTT